MKKLFLVAAALLFLPAAQAETGIRIVVPSHDIARGQTLSETDLAYQTIADASFMPGMVTSMKVLTGMETRRVLRAGESLRSQDVRHPILVTKGQTVTMTFEAPGIALMSVGRAMSEGGIGETVTVQNPASFRMISAIVTGPGTVQTVGVLSAPMAQGMRIRTQTARN